MQTYTHLSYTFNKVAQTVTLTGFTGSIEQIKLITDFTETTRTVIYDPASAWLWGSLAGSVLTLEFNTNTASFLNTDKLEIIIDPAVSATLALDGTDITTPFAMPAWWVWMRGWLSAIWTKINWSLAVTGTFFQATQPVSLATNTPTLQTWANVIGALIANQSVNTAQIWGVAPSMGSGVNGTWVQRVTLPTDRPPIADISAIWALAAAAQVVTLPLNGQSAWTGSITGIWVGTITWEGTIDGINYFPINAVSASTSSPQTTTTVNGLYRITPWGLTQMRANMSAFTSGSASIKLNASVGVGGTFVNQILPSKITDGTNTVAIFADGAGSFWLNTFLGGTNFPAAPWNTSTTQLGAWATFTGTIETMFLQQNIIININPI